MTDGILWCPHCGKPHRLGDRFCSVSGKPLDGQVHRPVRAQTPHPPLTGTTIDRRYRIVSLLGKGGMGEVYEAVNVPLGRRVAIKVVSAQRRTDVQEAVPRLLREARAVSAIQHPNICDVYDVGTLPDGTPYLVLERLVGMTLHERTRRAGRLPPTLVVELFGQILGALRAAHGAGIIHRDMKPANVFLVDRGGLPPLVKLLDFGFAMPLGTAHDWVRLTRPGRACGTPQYMSPEQLRADEPLDARTDVFSAGIMMYEALTGRHPFPGKTIAEVGGGILRDEPPPVSTVRRSLSPAFDDVIKRAIAKRREERYRSAVEMQVAVLALLPRERDEDAPDSTTDTLELLPRIPASTPTPSPV